MALRRAARQVQTAQSRRVGPDCSSSIARCVRWGLLCIGGSATQGGVSGGGIVGSAGGGVWGNRGLGEGLNWPDGRGAFGGTRALEAGGLKLACAPGSPKDRRAARAAIRARWLGRTLSARNRALGQHSALIAPAAVPSDGWSCRAFRHLPALGSSARAITVLEVALPFSQPQTLFRTPILSLHRHHSTTPLLIQKWHVHALCWWIDGATVGRPQKSVWTDHRGRRSGLSESEICTPQPPGQLMQAHFLTPVSVTSHSSPGGTVFLPGCCATGKASRS